VYRMNQIKFNRFLVSLITGTLLLVAPALRADTIIVEQPRWSVGFELGNGAAQSFTVTTAGTLNSFAILGNGNLPLSNTTFSLTLRQGDGLTGTILGTATGGVVSISGAKYYDAIFGSGLLLNPGKYTAVISDIYGRVGVLEVLGSTEQAYDGGSFLASGSGQADWNRELAANPDQYDLTFFTPIPAVPEPSSLALLLIGVIGTGGYVASKRYRRAAQS
jgi:PEP-CTERM motif